MSKYNGPNGRHVDLDDDTVTDLEALATITRETTAVLAARAVEALRRELVPTAARSRATTPASTGGRGRSNAAEGEKQQTEAQA